MSNSIEGRALFADVCDNCCFDDDDAEEEEEDSGLTEKGAAVELLGRYERKGVKG